MNNTSSKPAVVTKITLAPLRCRRALRPRVVPNTIAPARPISSPDSRITPTMDLMGSCAEEGNLPIMRSLLAPSTPMKSVKVPPVSIPHRILCRIARDPFDMGYVRLPPFSHPCENEALSIWSGGPFFLLSLNWKSPYIKRVEPFGEQLSSSYLTYCAAEPTSAPGE